MGFERSITWVSIIVPTYNREKTIDRAIQSILRQTYEWYEVIIVDDGSTDHTQDIVEQIPDDRIRYIRLPQNQGVSHARNEGICQSRFDYIAFLDSDDEWMPDKLELQMSRMSKSSNDVGMVYCRMAKQDEDSQDSGICPPYDWPSDIPLQGNLFPLLCWWNIIGAPTMLMRKRCLESVGGFKETLRCLEDWELVLRVAKKWQIGFVDEVLVRVHKSEGSVSMNPGAYLLSRCYMASKYRKEMVQMGLFEVVEKEILNKAEIWGLQEETRELLSMNFDL